MSDYVVRVETSELEASGWWFWVHVDRPIHYGPYVTEVEARRAREKLFRRWNMAARRKGGWMWKSTHIRWHLTLPDEVEVAAPRMANMPCSVHAPLPV